MSVKLTWTRFYDMHSGGGQKVSHDIVYVQAKSEDCAKEIFQEKFDRDPEGETCDCCGPDYSISTEVSLEELTKPHRLKSFDSRDLIPLGDYKKSGEALFIYTNKEKK